MLSLHNYVPAMQATEMRLAGNAEARGGDLQRAVKLYTEGIEQNPPSGMHMLYSNRAGARLASGNKAGAINDANTAAAMSPEGFHTAYIRQACHFSVACNAETHLRKDSMHVSPALAVLLCGFIRKSSVTSIPNEGHAECCSEASAAVHLTSNLCGEAPRFAFAQFLIVVASCTFDHIVQVEAYAALGKHREADTALQAAAQRDPSFRETKEYKSLNTQLSAFVQKVPRR